MYCRLKELILTQKMGGLNAQYFAIQVFRHKNPSYIKTLNVTHGFNVVDLKWLQKLD